MDLLPREAYTSFDDWYSYLINDYIPNKHPEDMELFIKIKFDPEMYYLYRKYKNGGGNAQIRKGIETRFKKVFKTDIKKL